MMFSLDPPRTISREHGLYLRPRVSTSRNDRNRTVYSVLYNIELHRTVDDVSRLVTVYVFPDDTRYHSFVAMEEAVEKRLADLREEDWNDFYSAILNSLPAACR